jgi:competence protein ComEA
MEAISRQQLIVYAAAALAIALIGARYLKQVSDRDGTRVAPAHARVEVRRERAGAHVYVTGAVRRPGVYRLPDWARLDLALKKAGGPSRSADLAAVNLAAKVSDGQQVVVPRRGAGGAETATDILPGGADAAAGAGAPVSLNTATAEQLDALDGVGPVTVQKILDWRKQHGGFSSIDELKQIAGNGPKRLAAL